MRTLVPLDDLVGLPFQMGARLPLGYQRRWSGPQPGVDCWGLVMCALERQGLRVPDPFTAQVETMAAKDWIVSRLAGWQRADGPDSGRVVEFRGAMAVPAHVGLCLDAQRFLHATDKAGVVIGRLDRAPWDSQIIGFYEYVG